VRNREAPLGDVARREIYGSIPGLSQGESRRGDRDPAARKRLGGARAPWQLLASSWPWPPHARNARKAPVGKQDRALHGSCSGCPEPSRSTCFKKRAV